jgi:diguanylate cyclase (GGDEF)-like protein
MKLKYKIFLGIFPLAAALLVASFLFFNRLEDIQRQEHINLAFASAAATLPAPETHQANALTTSADLISQQSIWKNLASDKSKGTLSSILSQIRKQASVNLVFYANQDGQILETNNKNDINDVRSAIENSFIKSAAAKKKTFLISVKGLVYQTIIVPVSSRSRPAFLGMASLFSFDNALRPLSGFEAAISGRDGNWIGSSSKFVPSDWNILDNMPANSIERITLSNGSYFARLIPLDPEIPASRVVVLGAVAVFDQGQDNLIPAFIFCMLIALLASIIIAGSISSSVSQPLEYLAQLVREFKGSVITSTAPLALTKRTDEVGAISNTFNLLANSLGTELNQKESALLKLEKFQAELLDLNRNLAKKLFENRVMLSLWREQEKAEDTKVFLSHILEEVLQGLPFHYGCIIIRPLLEIGPEVILARIERKQQGNEEVSVTDILERSDRTHWLSSLSPALKEFLLRMNQETTVGFRLLQNEITASIEPDGLVKELRLVSLRLEQGTQHMGSLHLITESENFSLSVGDEEFLQSVAAQMSVALENRSLQNATRVDPLTRLYNRNFMNDRLQEEMLRSSRTNRPFTLIILDIDYFKQVNDNFGHPAGDEVLLGVAGLLRRSCRASDAICRYGGEEIAIILVDTPLAGAKVFAENIRKTIANESFPIPEGKTIRITASMGIAEFPSQAASIGELVKHADDALYRAKREGRNIWRAFSA